MAARGNLKDPHWWPWMWLTDGLYHLPTSKIYLSCSNLHPSGCVALMLAWLVCCCSPMFCPLCCNTVIHCHETKCVSEILLLIKLAQGKKKSHIASRKKRKWDGRKGERGGEAIGCFIIYRNQLHWYLLLWCVFWCVYTHTLSLGTINGQMVQKNKWSGG